MVWEINCRACWDGEEDGVGQTELRKELIILESKGALVKTKRQHI
jgi:hypothetical protein